MAAKHRRDAFAKSHLTSFVTDMQVFNQYQCQFPVLVQPQDMVRYLVLAGIIKTANYLTLDKVKKNFFKLHKLVFY